MGVRLAQREHDLKQAAETIHKCLEYLEAQVKQMIENLRERKRLGGASLRLSSGSG
jgi:hypothetical protein